jgi:hypothetical protein
MRDLNEAVLEYPNDEELKQIVAGFADLLKSIVQTIDRAKDISAAGKATTHMPGRNQTPTTPPNPFRCSRAASVKNELVENRYESLLLLPFCGPGAICHGQNKIMLYKKKSTSDRQNHAYSYGKQYAQRGAPARDPGYDAA